MKTTNEAYTKYFNQWKNYPPDTLINMYRLSENEVAKDAICTILVEKLPDRQLNRWLQSRGALILQDEVRTNESY